MYQRRGVYLIPNLIHNRGLIVTAQREGNGWRWSVSHTHKTISRGGIETGIIA